MPTDMAAAVGGDKLPDSIMDLHPIRRIAALEEVTAVISPLAGPNGGYMTGGVIDLSGGLGI
jgi:NAD(P)-dependent dehydrogenase (short-subunit alcohol dehydrogenase family)